VLFVLCAMRLTVLACLHLFLPGRVLAVPFALGDNNNRPACPAALSRSVHSKKR